MRDSIIKVGTIAQGTDTKLTINQVMVVIGAIMVFTEPIADGIILIYTILL